MSSRTSCSSTRCSTVRRSSASWRACRAWSARPASACAWSRLRRRRSWRRANKLARVFTRIDHIGVAVGEIELSLALYRDRFELAVAHREILREQGVEALLLDIGENHVELLARGLSAPARNRRSADRDRAALRSPGGGMTAAARRIAIGFQGGQVLALRVSDEQLRALNRALGTTGWHEIDSEEGPVRLDLSQVVYVRSDSDELRVGF